MGIPLTISKVRHLLHTLINLIAYEGFKMVSNEEDESGYGKTVFVRDEMTSTTTITIEHKQKTGT